MSRGKSKLGSRNRSLSFVYKKQKAAICYYCFRCLTDTMQNGKNHNDTRTVDHFYPISKGGGNRQHNRVICCYWCNKLKEDLMPNEFLIKLNNMLMNKKIFHFSKVALQNIINQVNYIRRTYELHKAINAPYILESQPTNFLSPLKGPLELLRKKYFKHATVSPSNNKHQQVA